MHSSTNVSWHDSLVPGSHAHQQAKLAALQRYMAVRHVIAYYYTVHGIDVPAACDDYPVDRTSQPRSPKEFIARVAICHHLACEGFTADELSDIGRLVIHERIREKPMAEILFQCGILIGNENVFLWILQQCADGGPSDLMNMDWFERLTGFKEGPYDWTRNQMTVHGEVLRSAANGQSFQIGRFEMVSLAELRALSAAHPSPERRSRLSLVVGDVRRMHAMPGNATALFQVASQFNALEMIGPHVSPEDGVTRYEFDRTQGPACAIAAGAATIYRNYFVPNGGQTGQTSARQLDGLSDLGRELAHTLGTSVADLWTMQNGYALATLAGLERIADHINGLTPEQVDELAGHLRFGLHSDIEVTDSPTQPRPIVSQIFCSALPVAYGRHPVEAWRLFGQLVLDAAYEATLLAARLNQLRGKSNVVYLTLLGGSAFGNPTGWIFMAIKQAMAKASHLGLDVRVVSYGPPSHELQSLVRQISPFSVGNDGSDCTNSDNWLS